MHNLQNEASSSSRRLRRQQSGLRNGVSGTAAKGARGQELTLGHCAPGGGLGLTRGQGVADIKRQLKVAPCEEKSRAIENGKRQHRVGLVPRLGLKLRKRSQLFLLLSSESLGDVGWRFLARIQPPVQPLLDPSLLSGRPFCLGLGLALLARPRSILERRRAIARGSVFQPRPLP